MALQDVFAFSGSVPRPSLTFPNQPDAMEKECAGIPTTVASSPSLPSPKKPKRAKKVAKRGRPRAEDLKRLQQEGMEVAKDAALQIFQCHICDRIFPREKSLKAHFRIHTGDAPFVCTYPRCVRKFKQSGQLKTHIRTHTGEQPFVCPAPGCSTSFKHSNRHCKVHPGVSLVRTSRPYVLNSSTNLPEEERRWLELYFKKPEVCAADTPLFKQDGSATPKSPKKGKRKLLQENMSPCAAEEELAMRPVRKLKSRWLEKVNQDLLFMQIGQRSADNGKVLACPLFAQERPSVLRCAPPRQSNANEDERAALALLSLSAPPLSADVSSYTQL